jgi:hypothetical protein
VRAAVAATAGVKQSQIKYVSSKTGISRDVGPGWQLMAVHNGNMFGAADFSAVGVAAQRGWSSSSRPCSWQHLFAIAEANGNSESNRSQRNNDRLQVGDM